MILATRLLISALGTAAASRNDLTVAAASALVLVFLIAVAVLHRRERRDQVLAERLKQAARLQQRSASVRSFKEPAAKGFRRPGGGTAA